MTKSSGSFRVFLRVAVFCFCLFVAGRKISAAPHMEVGQPVWNFGAATNVAMLTHDFVIRNSGDAPLEISRVLSSCSACLAAGIEKTNIPPGGAAVLHSRLDLRLLSGEITRAILVDCNDPQSPSFALELAGWVVPAYQMVPVGFSLDLSQGRSAGTTEIFPQFKLHADLSRVICDDTNIEADVSPMPPAGFLLSVRVKETFPRGTAVAMMTVRSADSNDPPCRLSILIRNPPDLELIPEQLRFQPQAESQTRILWLKQHGSSPMALLDAVPSSDKYHCEIDPDPASYDYRIYVDARQQDQVAGQTNLLTLKLKDSQNREKLITVPILMERP